MCDLTTSGAHDAYAADAWTMVGGGEDDSRHGSTTPLPATSTTTTTATMATADEDSASTAVAIATMIIAPEIPRWRFIAKAKKTEGYSSHAAGSIVQGLSAEELAGRYSDWRRNVVPRNNVPECVLASTDDGMKEEEEGESHAREIGKLDISEATTDHDDVMFKYRVGREKRNIKDASGHGSTNSNDDDDDENSGHHHLLLHPILSADKNNDGRLDQVERLEQQQEEEQPVQELEVEEERSIISKHSKECESIIASSPALLPQTTEELPNPNISKQEHNQERPSKMMTWMMMLFLLLLLLAIILGITLGGSGRARRTTTDDKMIAGEGGISDVAALASTLHPIVAPSYSPSLTAQQQPTLVPNMISISQKQDAILEPTDFPTMSTAPSRFPTFKPTCETDYKDFNLCFAVDMSGSGTFDSSQPLKQNDFRS